MHINPVDKVVISVGIALGIMTFSLSYLTGTWTPFIAWLFIVAAFILTALVMVLWGAAESLLRRRKK